MESVLQKKFISNLYYVNLKRAQKYSIVLILIHIILLFIDIQRLLQQGEDLILGYRNLFYLHLVLTLGLLIFFILLRLWNVNEAEQIGIKHRVLLRSLAGFLLLMATVIAMNDQYIHGFISVYIIGVMGVSVAVYLSAVFRIALFSINHILFVILLSICQTNQDALIGHYINSSISAILAIIISSILYNSYLKSYNSEQTILRQSRELERLSMQDSLTGLYNRRYIEGKLQEEYSRSYRYSRPFSIALGDIDFFKQVNDTFSHEVGDRVLKKIGSIIQKSVRTVDSVSRYGGEEFLLILPETKRDTAYFVCEKIRNAIKTYPWSEIQSDLSVSISFGISDTDNEKNWKEMVNSADENLYAAKKTGRNKTVA